MKIYNNFIISKTNLNSTNINQPSQSVLSENTDRFEKSSNKPAFKGTVTDFSSLKANKEAKEPKSNLDTFENQLNWIKGSNLKLEQHSDSKIKQKTAHEILKTLDNLEMTSGLDKAIINAYETEQENQLDEYFTESFKLIDTLKKRGLNCETLEAVMDQFQENYKKGMWPDEFESSNNSEELGDINACSKENLKEFFDNVPIDKDTQLDFGISFNNFDRNKIEKNFKFILDQMEEKLKEFDTEK